MNGNSYSKTIFVTVSSGTSGCPATVNRTIVICRVLYRGARLSVTADAADQKPINSMKVYFDGSLQCTASAAALAANGNQITCDRFPVGSGTHRVTVRVWDSLGSFSVTKSTSLP